jgi:hypothetical protein
VVTIQHLILHLRVVSLELNILNTESSGSKDSDSKQEDDKNFLVTCGVSRMAGKRRMESLSNISCKVNRFRGEAREGVAGDALHLAAQVTTD